MNVNAQVVLTLDPIEFETIRELIYYVVNDDATMTQVLYCRSVSMALKLGVPVSDDSSSDEDDNEDHKLH